uniref:Reverse transcriptase domain-containing protein n=1 Tax=Rhabditophanes sp. KR3021 TaxID=114890 RepID=A0AC35U9Z1_9BILA
MDLEKAHSPFHVKQLDHILISNRKLLKDATVLPHAIFDPTLSDHRLLMEIIEKASRELMLGKDVTQIKKEDLTNFYGSIAILKKEDLRNVGKTQNYFCCSKSLTSHVYKIYAGLILSKLNPILSTEAGPYQHGFRKGVSTANPILIVENILEKAYEYKADIGMLFVDYAKAFDTLLRSYVFMNLARMGVEKHLPNQLQKLADTLKNVSAKYGLHINQNKKFHS